MGSSGRGFFKLNSTHNGFSPKNNKTAAKNSPMMGCSVDTQNFIAKALMISHNNYNASASP